MNNNSMNSCSLFPWKLAIIFTLMISLLYSATLFLPESMLDDVGEVRAEYESMVKGIKTNGIFTGFTQSVIFRDSSSRILFKLFPSILYAVFGDNIFIHHIFGLLKLMLILLFMQIIIFRVTSSVFSMFFSIWLFAIFNALNILPDEQSVCINFYRQVTSDVPSLLFTLLALIYVQRIFEIKDDKIISRRLIKESSLCLLYLCLGRLCKPVIILFVPFLFALTILSLVFFRRKIIFLRTLFVFIFCSAGYLVFNLLLKLIPKIPHQYLDSYSIDYKTMITSFNYYFKVITISWGPLFYLIILSYLIGLLITFIKKVNVEQRFWQTAIFFLFVCSLGIYLPWKSNVPRYLLIFHSVFCIFAAVEVSFLLKSLSDYASVTFRNQKNFLILLSGSSFLLVLLICLLGLKSVILFTVIILSVFVVTSIKMSKTNTAILKKLPTVSMIFIVFFIFACAVTYYSVTNVWMFAQSVKLYMQREFDEWKVCKAIVKNYDEKNKIYSIGDPWHYGSMVYLIENKYKPGRKISETISSPDEIKNLSPGSLIVSTPKNTDSIIVGRCSLKKAADSSNSSPIKHLLLTESDILIQTLRLDSDTSVSRISFLMATNFRDNEFVQLEIYDGSPMPIATSIIQGADPYYKISDRAPFDFETPVALKGRKVYAMRLKWGGSPDVKGHLLGLSSYDSYPHGEAILNNNRLETDLFFTVYSGTSLPVKRITEIGQVYPLQIIPSWESVWLSMLRNNIRNTPYFIREFAADERWEIYRVTEK